MTACPVCKDQDCHYWLLRLNETWHPAPAKKKPLWRLEPNHDRTTMVAAVDSKDAEFMVCHGWKVDDNVYFCEYEDAGIVEADGRVSVRMRIKS